MIWVHLVHLCRASESSTHDPDNVTLVCVEQRVHASSSFTSSGTTVPTFQNMAFQNNDRINIARINTNRR